MREVFTIALDVNALRFARLCGSMKEEISKQESAQEVESLEAMLDVAKDCVADFLPKCSSEETCKRLWSVFPDLLKTATVTQEVQDQHVTAVGNYNAASLEGCSWADVEIAFVSNDSVRIKIKGQKVERFTFSDINFKDGRRGDMPDTKWDLLMETAEKGKNELPDKGNLKQAVLVIRKRLRAIIPLEGDPLTWNSEKKRYVPVFRLEDKRFGDSG